MTRPSDILGEEDRRQLAKFLLGQRRREELCALHPPYAFKPHRNGQFQALSSTHTYRVLIPGNGWGKTTVMAADADLLMQQNDPYKPAVMPRGRPSTAIWVTQKYQQFEVMRPDLESMWSVGWQWSAQKHLYSWPNGSRLFILSSDSDWSAIQGVEIDAVYFDEHPDRKLWVEMQFRRRGKKRTRYMVAATMTLGITWFVQDVVIPAEAIGRELGITQRDRLEQQPHPTTFLWDVGGITDNPSMTEEDAEHYAQVTGLSDKEREVRMGGGYADFQGEAVFDPKALARMPIEQGENGALVFIPDEDEAAQEKLIRAAGGSVLGHRFAGVKDRRFWQWRPDMPIEAGRVTVFEEPDPDEASQYVIGADFAAGLVGKDYDSAIVGRLTADGQVVQVAEAHGHWGDIFFAEVLYALGVWYFEAFIVGERQFGLPALRRLYDEMGYTYLYHQRGESSRSRRFSDLLGHHRSAGDTIIANHRLAVARGDVLLKSRDALTEHSRYQFRPRRTTDTLDDVSRSADLTTGAPDGEHDDLVMAAAYVTHASREVSRFPKPEPAYAPGTFGDVFQVNRVLKPARKKGVELLR